MSFKEIIGQETAVRILQDALKKERWGMSYLFYGPKGIGKSLTARQFAKALNCEVHGGDSCDICISCRKTDRNEYTDFHWLDFKGASDSIKIEQVRQLQADLSLRPFEARVKVFIINNCERLTLEAANCLLKVLEEPAVDSVLVLIASSLKAVLPTIASRCYKINFSNLSYLRVKKVLEEKYTLSLDRSRYLARYLDGRIGAAISLSGSSFIEFRDRVLDGFLKPSNQRELEELFRDKGKAREVIFVLFSWFRDIMYVKAGGAAGCLINEGLSSRIESEALRYSYPELLSAFSCLYKSLEHLERNINSRLLVDNLMVNLWKE